MKKLVFSLAALSLCTTNLAHAGCCRIGADDDEHPQRVYSPSNSDCRAKGGTFSIHSCRDDVPPCPNGGFRDKNGECPGDRGGDDDE